MEEQSTFAEGQAAGVVGQQAQTSSQEGIKVSTGSPAAAATTEPQKSITWTDNLPMHLKDYVNVKGFKDPAAVLESYVNLEKLRGVPSDKLLKIPDSPEAKEWNDIYIRLGKPVTPEGYKLAESEGGDNTFTNWAKETFHSLNLTEAQGRALAEKFSEFVVQSEEQSKAQSSEVLKTQEANLKKEWGMAYEQNLNNARRAHQSFNIPDEAVLALEQSIGFDGTMKLLNSIGQKLMESAFISGDTRSGMDTNILTPEEAKARIKALKGDPDFTSKYLKGDFEARKRLENLHKMASSTD